MEKNNPNAGKNRPSKDEGVFWSIVGYLLSGFLIWGGLGALADHFLGTRYLVPAGLLVGMTSSLFLVWFRFVKE